MDAALRLLSAVRMASVTRLALSDEASRPSRPMVSTARSFDEAAEKKPNTAIPTRSNGRSDRKAERVMAEASSPPWSSL